MKSFTVEFNIRLWQTEERMNKWEGKIRQLKLSGVGVLGWLSQLSIQLLVLVQVVISWFMGLSPTSGSVLTARSLEPASDAVSPSLCASPLLTLCLPLSFKNK